MGGRIPSEYPGRADPGGEPPTGLLLWRSPVLSPRRDRMGYYVVLRGPLGVGKTTVARKVARRLGARYISIDRILDAQGFWYDGRLSEFLNANRVAATLASRPLAQGVPVVLDGNFYWRTQLRDLARRLHRPHLVCTLEAPVEVCIARDARRIPSHGADAARAVHAKSTAFDAGVRIDADRPLASVVREIVERIRRDLGAGSSSRRRARALGPGPPPKLATARRRGTRAARRSSAPRSGPRGGRTRTGGSGPPSSRRPRPG